MLGCLSALLALGVLAASAYALWTIFSGLQKEVAAALVTGAAAVVVSLGSLLGSQATKDAHLKEYFPRMAPGFITWADDRVIVEWARFREALSNQTFEEGKVALPPLLAFERLLLAIRKDLGHANRGIQTGDVLAVWITDIRTSLGPRKG